MVRPQAELCTGIPRLDIIRIRQPNSPNDEFIISKEKKRAKNCIKINVFKQLNIPYSY